MSWYGKCIGGIKLNQGYGKGWVVDRGCNKTGTLWVGVYYNKKV